MSAGGSHTAFDGGAFTAGALGGAGLVAGALVTGAVNAVRARKETSEIEYLRSALHAEGLLRNHHVDRAKVAEARASSAEKRARGLEVLLSRALLKEKQLTVRLHMLER